MIGVAISLMSEKCVCLKYCSMAGNASSFVRSRTPALRTSYHWEAYSARNVPALFSRWARRELSYRDKSLAFSCSLFIYRSPPGQVSESERTLVPTCGRGVVVRIIISQQEQISGTFARQSQTDNPFSLIDL